MKKLKSNRQFEIGIPYVKLQATNTASAADVLGIRHTPRGMESTQIAQCKEEEILPDYSSKDGIRRRSSIPRKKVHINREKKRHTPQRLTRKIAYAARLVLQCNASSIREGTSSTLRKQTSKNRIGDASSILREKLVEEEEMAMHPAYGIQPREKVSSDTKIVIVMCNTK